MPMHTCAAKRHRYAIPARKGNLIPLSTTELCNICFGAWTCEFECEPADVSTNARVNAVNKPSALIFNVALNLSAASCSRRACRALIKNMIHTVMQWGRSGITLMSSRLSPLNFLSLVEPIFSSRILCKTYHL